MKQTKPKLLVLDIETMAAKGYIWKMFKENVSLDQLIEAPRIISFAAKFIGDKHVMQHDEYSDPAFYPLKWYEYLYSALEMADAVVTFNGDRFDLPKVNGLFAELGLKPLPPITSIDLYKTVRKLGFISNKLEHAVTKLRLGHKLDTNGFKLWRAWDEGNEAAIAKMRRYNIYDVKLTERLYRRLRPWIKNHPYMGNKEAATDTECPACQSTDTQHRGERRTKAYFIERLQCNGCGAWFDGKRRKAVRVNNGKK